MIFLGIFLIMLSISFHEIGHAYAMAKNGVAIGELCVFGVGPKLFTFRLRRWFGETPITIRMIPIMAFVRPVENDPIYKGLKFRKRTHIHGAGVIANILFAGLIMVSVGILNHSSAIIWWTAIICIIIGVFPRITSHLVLPIGIFIMVVLIHFIVSRPLQEFQKGSGSLVLVTQEMHKVSADDGKTPVNVRLARLFSFAALISLSLGAFNAMPLSVLDGGRIAQDILERAFKKHRRMAVSLFHVLTFLPFVALVLSALFGDLMRLIGYLF